MTLSPDSDATPREVWMAMSELVLSHSRRREVSEAVGLSFARIRAIRRVARRPMSMKDLAAALNIDPPNVTSVVDDLEALGLAVRRPHPTDRRAKLVEVTPEGQELAARAEDILSTPPPGLAAFEPEELELLSRLIRRAAAPE